MLLRDPVDYTFDLFVVVCEDFHFDNRDCSGVILNEFL